ncbi:flagellar filament capping protein FliD [Telluria mixta]|uniref:Flagellar hook-associated protein 2 n=1 Tax=Telluria mixta TaxID=34071 RepID=A0ABT2C5M9_9BURK|nr:flagellar filament capping protein FliD [Telluria mixta]MCS0632685.1 flagellar filament capping protein FliD [Telluria mixta]WEM99020.1 flagellar filament capping protein FliD [Telluria mixta]
MGISSPGIGSGLDINGLVSKLMAAESAPLNNYDSKTADYQNKLQAYGKVSAAVGTFQGALTKLNSADTFSALTSSSSNKDLLTASAGAGAVPGKYKINVSQLAQAQSLMTSGQSSNTKQIGDGAKTTLTFQFGGIGGGTFGVAGSALSLASATTGIATGSLTINGTAISTNGTTRSARDLAATINDETDTTGVTAKAGITSTSATLFGTFGDVAVTSGNYALTVGGVQLASSDGSTTVTAATLDTALGTNTVKNQLAAANITVTGSAANGDLQFFAADGSNISVTEAVSGTVTGGIGLAAGAANAGSDTTATAGITLSSKDGSQILVGGNNPAAAGLAAGSAGSFIGAGFTQDGAQASGTVTLDTKDQTLQGIRDAINKANVGVTATIVSDGSTNPYHLVITSNKTGEKSAMKITVDGADGGPVNAGIASLLAYDPNGTQALTQTSGAQDTKLTMNGIAVSSADTTVDDIIQGVSLDLSQTGSTTLTVSQDTSSVKDAINSFVKAYNDLNKTISGLTGYNADTKTGGVLQGDSAVRSIQTQLRRALGNNVEGLDSNLSNLSQIGVSFQRDGSLALDSTKLSKAMSSNFSDISGLFAAVGAASDGNITFDKSTAATKPGEYAVNITRMASQGTLTGANPLSGSTTIAANTTWTITLNQTDPASDKKVQNIKIPAGTYANDQLASMLRAAINGNATFAGGGDAVETSVDSTGHLSISSSKYGSTSNIAIAGVTGTAVSDLFGGATPAVGTDIEGTIGNVAATGNGQSLTAAAGSPAAGIQITVKTGTTGDRGTVTFSQGYAYQLTNLAASFTGKDSVLNSKTDGLNASIKAVAKQRDAFSDHLTQLEAMYKKQFTSLDTMLQSMQSTQSYLTQQLAALAANA